MPQKTYVVRSGDILIGTVQQYGNGLRGAKRMVYTWLDQEGYTYDQVRGQWGLNDGQYRLELTNGQCVTIDRVQANEIYGRRSI